jgi:hypothetical protein
MPTIDLTYEEYAAGNGGDPARHRARQISACPASRSVALGAGKSRSEGGCETPPAGGEKLIARQLVAESIRCQAAQPIGEQQ